VSTPLLQIIVASTRPGRVGLPVSEWFVERARAHGGFDIEIVDLAVLDLPFLDEPNHPRLRQYTQEHTKAWSAQVDRADAFVLVMPEYNHGYNAPLKNAIDFLFHEWNDKAVGFVSYGGIAGGTRAVQLLKPVLSEVKMVPVLEAVNIPFVRTLIKDGVLETSETLETSATAMLDELVRVTAALRTLRPA
jgi:NAD(P)H-dependent FMN reductase